MSAHETVDVVVLSGGTGGHVIPAEILNTFFVNQGLKTIFITDQRGERYLQDQTRQGACVIPVMTGSFLRRLWGVFKSSCLLMRHMRNLQPKVIIGFGGYPSAGGGVAAFLLRIPLFVHEQNAVLGRVNRLLGWIAKGVFLTFPDTRNVSSYVHKKALPIITFG